MTTTMAPSDHSSLKGISGPSSSRESASPGLGVLSPVPSPSPGMPSYSTSVVSGFKFTVKGQTTSFARTSANNPSVPPSGWQQSSKADMHFVAPETCCIDVNRGSASLDHSCIHNSQSNNRGGTFQNRGSSPELLGGSEMVGGWSQITDSGIQGLHFATSMSSMNPTSGSPMSQTSSAVEAGASMQEIMGIRLGVNHSPKSVMPPLGSSYGASPQRLGSGLLTTGNSWSAAMDTTNRIGSPAGPSSGVTVALQGAADLATSHCLAQFSSDPGFAERAAKFSSFSNANYSQTPFALGPDGVKPRGRSIAGDMNDGKLSRSSSCSRLAKLAPSSIMTVRTSHGYSVQSKSPEIKAYRLYDQATAIEPDGREMEKSPVMRDDKKLQGGMPGSSDTASMEAFEGATEIDAARQNDTDEADGFEHSSGSEQARGDRRIQNHGSSIVENDIVGKRKILLPDEYRKEPGGRNGQTADGDDANVKRQRSGENAREDAKLRIDRTLSESYSGESSPLSMKDQSPKPPEPPKQDYIHVRARRGQATDSHSLAERVRREKISERMKFLQDLVPGCSKVTGKAVMLDEIINYVQSLQRQIEFLSMKLAAVNPGMDCTVDNFLSKQQMQGSTAPMMMGPDTTTMSYGHHHQQSQQRQVHNLQSLGHSGLDFTPLESPAEASLQRTMSTPVSAPLSCLDAFGDNLSQLSSGWEGELQSVVNMGFLQGRPNAWLPQESHCQMQAGQTKVEL